MRSTVVRDVHLFEPSGYAGVFQHACRVADALDVPIADLRHAWDHGLARSLGWEGS